MFYADIEDGLQKWWENTFWEKSSVDSANILWVKNLVEIALSHTFSEILKIFHFKKIVEFS